MMRFYRSLKNNSLVDRRGQVAIFIALIFQLLFLFFAMVINVGLLVHHKINLQNSVDLAAYYGAMKQAEVMNAIGHVNYQIRQSYKLLTWRYRVLGTSGVFPEPRGQGVTSGGHPNAKGDGANTGRQGATIRFDDSDTHPTSGPLVNFYERPAFCVAFRPFDEVPPNESTCQAPEGQTISALRAPPIIAGFVGAARTARRVTELANQSFRARCEFAGPFNYVALARFLVAYNIDQGERKLLIYKLANNISQSTDDFIDIEGESGKDGIRTTLEKNLTSANKDSIKDFRIFNALASGNCRQRPGAESTPRPPGWLSDVVIFPRASYKMCTWNAGANYTVKNIDIRPGVAPAAGPEGELGPLISYLDQYVKLGDPNSPYRPSLGVEKNPWCMSYVGVRAETEPAIPFSLGKIRMKAVAFAKPFGGRIGPWYGRTWSISSSESSGSGNERTDPRTPPRCPMGNMQNCSVEGQDAVTTVNYSRFPGDPVGLASRAVHAQYGKAIFDLGNMSFNMWSDIEATPNDRSGETDILAWSDRQPDKKFRDLEIASVVPDIFDLTYYSIDPDFHKNYYQGRLQNYLQKYPISASYRYRGDIGHRTSGFGLPGNRGSSEFTIRDQMDVAQRLQGSSNNAYNLDWQSKLMYAVVGGENFHKVLTGWISKPNLVNYDFDPDRFGKCRTPASSSAPVPGSCVQGGRTGYSVKIVSSEYLFGTHRLGGDGSGANRLINPPEEDFIK